MPLFEAHNLPFERSWATRRTSPSAWGTWPTISSDAIGALAAAEANLRRSIALCREIGDEFREAVGHQELGRLLAYRGAWAESERELDAALRLFEKEKDVQSQGVDLGLPCPGRVCCMARDQSANPNPGR